MGVRAHFGQQVTERHIDIQRFRALVGCRRGAIRRFRRRSFSTFNLLQVLMGPVNDAELMNRLVKHVKICPRFPLISKSIRRSPLVKEGGVFDRCNLFPSSGIVKIRSRDACLPSFHLASRRAGIVRGIGGSSRCLCLHRDCGRDSCAGIERRRDSCMRRRKHKTPRTALAFRRRIRTHRVGVLRCSLLRRRAPVHSCPTSILGLRLRGLEGRLARWVWKLWWA